MKGALRTLGVLVVLRGLLACEGDSPRAQDAGAGDAPGSAPDAPEAGEPAAKIVLVADAPSHGRGEHEYRAGTILLATMLAALPRISVTLLPAFPSDEAALEGARAIVLYTNGGGAHPLLAAEKSDAMARALARGTGLTALHWSTEGTEALGDRMLGWLGAYAVRPASVFPIWEAQLKPLPDHAVTRGVPPFQLDDEWYFGLRFTEDARLHPILTATPPDALRTTPETARHPGRAETLAWTFERADGGRSFGYVGGHFHVSWGSPSVRRLVVNAILWTAGQEVPAGGAPVDLPPGLLERNLDDKP